MGFSWTLGYSGFVGVIAFLALAVGGPYLIEKFFKVPVLSAVRRFPVVGRLVNPAFAGILGIALVVLVAMPFVSPDTAKSIGGTGETVVDTTTDSTSDDTATVSAACNRPTGGNTATYQLTAENRDNPSDAYIGHTAYFVGSDDVIEATAGLTTGTVLTYTSVNVKPCVSGTLYLVGNSTSATSFSTNEPLVTNTADSALGTNMTIDILNFNTGASIVANGTRPTDGTSTCPASIINCGAWAGGTQPILNDITVQNQTLASGGSFNFKYTLTGATANGRFGGFGTTSTPAIQGYIVSARITDLTALSSSGGVKIASPDGGASLAEIDCALAAGVSSNRNADKCWRGSSLKSGFAYTGSGTITCDLGDCAPLDYVDVCWDDLQWVQDTDGKMKLLAFTATGTNVGAATTCARFFLN